MQECSELGVIAAGAGALPGARRRCAAGKRTHGPGPRACLALLAAAALALGVAENAAAQTTLVSNVVATSGVAHISFTQEAAQAFTTGATGATVSSVEIISSDTQGDDFDLSLCATSANDRPTSTCTELTAPSSFAAGTLVFIAPANTTLDPTTTYAVLMTPESASVTVPGLGSNDEDTGGAMGWTIADTHQFTNPANDWRTSTPGGGRSMRIAIKGTLTASANTAAMGAPTITGTAQVGQTLTAVTTGITDADGLTSPTYTYQWIRVDGTDEEDISGENSSTYTLVDADLGKTIKVKVSFTDDASNAETLTSAATVTVAADTTPPEVESVTVASTGSDVYLVFDEGLDGTAGAALPSSAFSLTVAGQAVTIHNYNFHEAEMTLTVQSGTIKQGQTVVVSYTDPTTGDDTVALQDSAGNDVASFTTGMSGVPAVTNNSTNTAATGEPAISGTATAGQVLTATTGTIADADGLPSTFTYQWVRVDADGTSNEEEITGEILATYTLTNDDVGNKVKVKVSFTDELSGEEERTSAAYPTSGTVQASSTPVSAALVSNVGQTAVSIAGLAANDLAQSFRTGTNAAGYTLTSIELRLSAFGSTVTPTVKLYSGSANGTEVDVLTGPSMLGSDAANYPFTPSSTVTLLMSTTYWVVAEGDVYWTYTNSTSEDATPAPGWGIGDHRESRAASSTGSFTASSGFPLEIRVNGTTVATTTTNNAPTAANNTVTTGEDRPYTFEAGDFGFVDTDTGDTLASVKIVTPPGLGTLALDGTAVLADDVVTEAQIDGDMLTFTPALNAHGDPYTTFTFTVNDGTDDSASAYTMSIDVTDAPAPVCGVPDIAGDGRRQIWTGTVTVGALTSVGVTEGYGFLDAESFGELDLKEFDIGSNNHSIDAIGASIGGRLFFALGGIVSLTATETAALRLHVCDGDYDFSTATPAVDNMVTFHWTTATLDWSPPVVTRTVYLSLPANNVATGEPAITGTAVAGQELTATAGTIMDTDGVPSSFTYQWLRVDADGTSNPADITDATAATYTLTAADAGKKIKVQVSFTDELSGEEERTSAAYPSSGTVTAASTTAPALLSVTVTSTPRKTTDTYGAREHIEFSMTFDAPVTVTGDPTFAFDLGGASTASYYAGSGTTTLRFSHAVSGGSSGDEDTNGISWAQTAIALNGGTIAGTDNAVAAVLTHAAQSNLAGHKVDGRTTAVTPATVTVAVTSTPTSLADTYGFGETIVITVTASEAVEVEGDPEFEFSMNNPGGAANDVPATYDRTRSSPTTMAFAYTVQAGDMDSDGIWIGTHSRTFMLDVNDRIRTASQQIDIDRSHPEKGTLAGHKVNGSLGAPTVPPDPTAPTLVSATATTLTIEWTHPGDGGSPLTRNFIEYRVEGTTDWTNWYRGETPTQVTRTVITNLAAATAYDVRVHSTNAIGNSQWVQSATAFSTLAGTAATGAPTITGTAAVGQPLAVDLTGIADADGLTNVSYSYQWVRVDADGLSNPADIADATDATYTLDDADLGKTLKVRVTFDDDGGNTETLTSAATATVTPAAGAPTSPTTLSATVGVGQVVLVWQHSQGLGGGTRSHYEYRSSAGAMIAPDAMWQQVQTSGGGPQAYFQVVKGLTSDTTHTFQVRAVNPQGGSAPATVTVTPLSQPSCTIDELGDRRLLWQGQLTAGTREIYTDGNIDTGYGGWRG